MNISVVKVEIAIKYVRYNQKFDTAVFVIVKVYCASQYKPDIVQFFAVFFPRQLNNDMRCKIGLLV